MWVFPTQKVRRNPDNPDIVDQFLYINGTLVASNESEWVDPGSTVFLGGGHSGSDDCNGVFDDFRIYDCPITLEEVRQLASQGQ